MSTALQPTPQQIADRYHSEYQRFADKTETLTKRQLFAIVNNISEDRFSRKTLRISDKTFLQAAVLLADRLKNATTP